MEGRGRRVFPARPEQSLLLLKATGQVAARRRPARSTQDSLRYRRLRRWIAEGAPFSSTADAARSRAIEVEPAAARPGPGRHPAAARDGHRRRGPPPLRDRRGRVRLERRRPSPASTAAAWSRPATSPARRPSWSATWATSPSAASPCPRPGVQLRPAAGSELHRPARLGQAAAARHPAERPGRRRHLPAPRLPRHDRHAADRRRRPARSWPTPRPTSGPS